ncbi:MAG: PaaI family thioesterase [Anaerolineae bacterium]|nr:PaaI family thioesterase [Anaerolineae bacterium]
MTDQLKRSHTFEWEDPLIAAKAGQTMSGLDYMKAMSQGELPPAPIALVMNLRFIEVEYGRIVATSQPLEYLYNPIGTVHGGYAATLLDTVMACAIHTTLPVGVGYTTLEIKVNYLRPITLATGMIYGEGKLIHAGRRMGTSEGRLTDAEGKLYAHGTTTCMIMGE